jgi:hypothetical protein
MLPYLTADEILEKVADALETVVLPGLSQSHERRQCRSAVFLIRSVAAAGPHLDTAVALDTSDFTLVLGQALGEQVASEMQEAAVPSAHERRRAHRDATFAASDAARSVTRSNPGLQVATRESLDRWIAVLGHDPAHGGFVRLNQSGPDEGNALLDRADGEGGARP